MLADPVGSEATLFPRIMQLQEDGKKHSENLISALDTLIQDVNARAIEAAQANNEKSYQEVLSVLLRISPRTSGSPVWRSFLEELSKQRYYYFIQHWFVRERLLDIARQVLQPGNAKDDPIVEPLLNVVPPDFGKLLAVPSHGMRKSRSDEADVFRLPAEWNYLAIKQSITACHSTSLSQEIIQYFEQDNEHLRILFGEIVGLSYQDRWEVLRQFFNKLMDGQYNRKKRKTILFQILEARPPQKEAEDLLTMAGLDEEEQRELFGKYKDLCIEFLPLSPVFRGITLRNLLTCPLTWERISNFVFMLGELPKTNIHVFASEIAAMLDICIESPIRLGMLFSSLIRLESATATSLLSNMVAHARKAIDEVIAVEERGESVQNDAMRRKASFSAYVQFALCPDTTYGTSARGVLSSANLLHHLLQGANKRVFDFVTRNAEHWPAELRVKWEKERKKYDLSLKNVAQVSSLPAESSGKQGQASIAFPQQSDLEMTEQQKELLSREERKIARRMDKLLKKRRARKLAVFWLENHVTLMAMADRGVINQDDQVNVNWQHCMRIAYNFYVACKEADNTPEISMNAEQAIINAYGESHNYGELLHFTGKEIKRYKIAQKRVREGFS